MSWLPIPKIVVKNKRPPQLCEIKKKVKSKAAADRNETDASAEESVDEEGVPPWILTVTIKRWIIPIPVFHGAQSQRFRSRTARDICTLH